MTIHKPVLLKESIENLNLKKGDVVVDATLGGGGHSLAILEKIMPGGVLIAIDKDESAVCSFAKKIKYFKPKLKKENVKIIRANFADLKEIFDSLKVEKADAILADFGCSSDQLENSARGFSFQKEGRLDMRFDLRQSLSARDVVNGYGQNELERVLRLFGEEKYARSIAGAIAEKRKQKPIKTTSELVEIIRLAVPKKYQYGKIHFATRTFQAIRMEVNRELENIGIFLRDAVNLLKKRGRLAVISFHSGEDREVKLIFAENARGCICPPKFPKCLCGREPAVRIISKKPIVPSRKEVLANTKSRSAKLRIVEKI